MTPMPFCHKTLFLLPEMQSVSMRDAHFATMGSESHSKDGEARRLKGPKYLMFSFRNYTSPLSSSSRLVLNLKNKLSYI